MDFKKHLADFSFSQTVVDNLKISGVLIPDSSSVYISPGSTIASGVIIYPNTYILGTSEIKENAQIGPNVILCDTVIGKDATIYNSSIFNSMIGERTSVGPYAHIRDKAIIGNNLRIGNFVEIKKSSLGNDTKASHLAYIGDSQIGENVNFGCGSITVNYDGYKKSVTKIGNNVFIGCNSNLIAPVEIGDNSFIAAGSTVTENVPIDGFVVGRVKQITKLEYAPKLKDKIKKKATE